eukprot:2493070-Pleurochrysis_carterae.AAC.1
MSLAADRADKRAAQIRRSAQVSVCETAIRDTKRRTRYDCAEIKLILCARAYAFTQSYMQNDEQKTANKPLKRRSGWRQQQNQRG